MPKKIYPTSIVMTSLTLILIFSSFYSNAFGQDTQENVKLTRDAKIARDQCLRMLDEMKEILTENYYDPKLHGIDLPTRIDAAKVRVRSLQYNWQMYRVLVQVLMDFNDSHTRMILPPRTDYFQYGFGMQMIGDDCLVTSVKKDSDAKSQGLEVGDQIVLLGKLKPTRRDLWKMTYVLYKLDPADTLDLKIRKLDGSEKAITVKAKKMTDKEYQAEQKARRDKTKEQPFKCQEIDSQLVACKLYSFAVEKNDIDKMMDKASKYPKLILDLRGNGGGYVVIEQYLLSYFFDREIKIADLIGRKKTESRFTKPLGDKFYKGEVSILVDSGSASASEITARAMQIEKRAKIYGDISSGSVMTSIALPFESLMSALADAAIIKTGMSVSIADVVMRDGSRLENTGVIPDEVLQPSGLAFSKSMDAVLAYAAMKMGSTISPEKAGTFYFLSEKPETDDDDDHGN